MTLRPINMLWVGSSLGRIEQLSIASFLSAGHRVKLHTYGDIANVPQSQHEHFYSSARARLEPFGDRSTIWRMSANEAAPRIPRHSLDFVYIDARHDFDSVLEDLDAWYDKVRPGGIIAGHDYLDGNLPAGDFGVKSAVDAYFLAKSLPVCCTLLDQPWLSWLVEVPPPPGSNVVPQI